MLLFSIIFVLFSINSVIGYTYDKFEYELCGDSNNHVFAVRSVEVSPVPIILPGRLTLHVTGNITRAITGGSLKMRMWKGSWLRLPIPCFRNIGGCDYDDLCTVLHRMKTENWMGFAGDISEQLQLQMYGELKNNICPITTGLVNSTLFFDLPQLPSVLNILTDGDYSVKAEMYDTTGAQAMCVTARLSVKPRSKGWLIG